MVPGLHEDQAQLLLAEQTPSMGSTPFHIPRSPEVWSCPGDLPSSRGHQTKGHFRPGHWNSCVHSGSIIFPVIISRIPNHNKIKFYKIFFFLSGCYSNVFIMSTGVCSGSQGKMVAELETKLREISFSVFLSTKECSFPNQSDRMSSKAKQQTYQLI